MFITDLFKFTHNCKHENVTPDRDIAYCPDCGKLVKNEWYITRCSCCGVKLKTMVKNGQIVPQHNFCSNCGANDFIIEKLEQINFIDINFAALKKCVVDENLERKFSTTCCWQEKTISQPKLLVQYL